MAAQLDWQVSGNEFRGLVGRTCLGLFDTWPHSGAMRSALAVRGQVSNKPKQVLPTNPLNSLPETCQSIWAAIQPTFV